MIAICLKEGLTCAGKVLKEGEVFKLPDYLERDYVKGFAASRSEKRQCRVFGKVLFRQATVEEVFEGLKRGQVKEKDLTEEERDAVKKYVGRLVQLRVKRAEDAADELYKLLGE